MEQIDGNILALWLAQFSERLSWFEQAMADMEAPDLAYAISGLEHRIKELQVLLHDAKQYLSNTVEAEGGKQLVIETPDGNVLAEVTKSNSRSEIKREQLYADFKTAARLTPVVHSETGEILTGSDAVLAKIEQAFRMEPRWTEIRKMGLDPDEYARSDWKQSLKITGVKKAS